MTEKQEPHKHDFKKLGFIREFQTGICRPNKLVPDPDSKDINRIILIRSCECGQEQAFECGSADEMRVLFAQLKGK